MKFDGTIVRPKGDFAPDLLLHLPLFLTRRGAEAVAAKGLDGLRRRVGREIRFAMDTRYRVRIPGEGHARAPGAYLKGFMAPKKTLELDSWVYAQNVFEEFGFNIDISQALGFVSMDTRPLCPRVA